MRPGCGSATGYCDGTRCRWACQTGFVQARLLLASVTVRRQYGERSLLVSSLTSSRWSPTATSDRRPWMPVKATDRAGLHATRTRPSMTLTSWIRGPWVDCLTGATPSERSECVCKLPRTKPDRSEGFDVAIASTDTSATAAQLIARYDSRWTIETAHQEAKANGVGQARNRVERAVERTVPFGFLAQTITITWYALHGNPNADLQARRRAAPWYRQKATISYSDMLAALRHDLIRHEYWAQAPTTTSTPQITPAPTWPALTAA